MGIKINYDASKDVPFNLSSLDTFKKYNITINIQEKILKEYFKINNYINKINKYSFLIQYLLKEHLGFEIEENNLIITNYECNPNQLLHKTKGDKYMMTISIRNDLEVEFKNIIDKQKEVQDKILNKKIFTIIDCKQFNPQSSSQSNMNFHKNLNYIDIVPLEYMKDDVLKYCMKGVVV